jgi:dienelactone hydrolase
MAHVILFHSALGLRPGVHSFAKQLHKAGYTVTTPDLYNDAVFEDYEAGARNGLQSVFPPSCSRPMLLARSWMGS